MKKYRPIVTTYELIELATKQGFQKKDITTDIAIIAIMYKHFSNFTIQIFVNITGSHEFNIHIDNFGTISLFKKYYFKNIALFEKEAKTIYKRLTRLKYDNTKRVNQ